MHMDIEAGLSNSLACKGGELSICFCKYGSHPGSEISFLFEHSLNHCGQPSQGLGVGVTNSPFL